MVGQGSAQGMGWVGHGAAPARAHPTSSDHLAALVLPSTAAFCCSSAPLHVLSEDLRAGSRLELVSAILDGYIFLGGC